LAEDLDPEELQMLVSGIFEDLAEEELRYDGMIEKFIGDAIFVIFGAPIAHEDKPQRALRCAIGMQKLFAEHSARVKAQLGIELGLRIGIHSGMVVAGAVRAPAEYGVMGDTVNTASRLQQAAAQGEIYVTQATFRLTNREFSFREVGPIVVERRIDPNDADAATKLTAKLRDLGFASPELVVPTLGQFFHMPGSIEPPSDSDEWKRSMFIGVYDVIASLARERPLLYVLEDLHFADSASLELLWFVASRASRVPILLLLAQRAGPGSPEPRPVRTNFSQLVLEPLSDEEAARII